VKNRLRAEFRGRRREGPTAGLDHPHSTLAFEDDEDVLVAFTMEGRVEDVFRPL